MASSYITVIGASNIDIGATASNTLIGGDSNPGTVQTHLGGVGRNIAENLARLQLPVHLITAYGDDVFASMLQSNAMELGINTSASFQGTDLSSSLYICINQPEGEMAVAISDMECCKHLTKAHLRKHMQAINQSEMVVLDTNLPVEAIAYLAETCKVPLYVDTVSISKAAKLRGLLPHFTGIKTNPIEATLLTGVDIHTQEDGLLAAKALHEMGARHVMITLGSKGALVSNGETAETLPPMATSPINTTGCGDAFFAGALYQFLQKASCWDILRYGLGMAALCAASPYATSRETTPDVLHSLVQKYDEGMLTK